MTQAKVHLHQVVVVHHQVAVLLPVRVPRPTGVKPAHGVVNRLVELITHILEN